MLQINARNLQFFRPLFSLTSLSCSQTGHSYHLLWRTALGIRSNARTKPGFCFGSLQLLGSNFFTIIQTWVELAGLTNVTSAIPLAASAIEGFPVITATLLCFKWGWLRMKARSSMPEILGKCISSRTTSGTAVSKCCKATAPSRITSTHMPWNSKISA